MKLSNLKPGEWAEIIHVGGEGALRQHFLDMGLIPGSKIKFKNRAPSGDPLEFEIRGYSLSLRRSDAEKIEIKTAEPEIEKETGNFKKIPHPKFGESKPSLFKKEVLDKKTVFALVGNQNSGKTTLFNALTGSNQHVGNFPGVTVERKSGAVINYENTEIVDLPGIYSLSPYSGEEIISRDFVLNEKPDAIINIVDVNNIERNLYLTMQILELNVPTVLALNMMDEFSGNGGIVDVNGLEKALGIPVVPISARNKMGIDELSRHAVTIAKNEEKPVPKDLCEKGDAIHRSIHGVKHLIDDHAKRSNIPSRFAATKVIEGDELILKSLDLDGNEEEMIEHIIVQMENETGLDRKAAIAKMRYKFIEKIVSQTIGKPKENKEKLLSERLDKIFTGKYTAIPLFILIMGLVFFLTFNVLGAFLQNALEQGISLLTEQADAFLISKNVNATLKSLIIHGIFKGVGSVVSFLPIIVVLFFFLSILEDSGYIARVAFFMDSSLRKLGLSGRSIVPLLIGFGCTVPAVMSARTLPSNRDRKMTILLTPFMSCSAKLPIYAYISNIFFKDNAGPVMTALYFLGIFLGIIIALIYNKILFKGEAAPFVMELPNYRLPTAKNVGILLKEKATDFLSRAFSVIFVATVIMWFLNSFDIKFNPVINGDSILKVVASSITPVFKPVGLDDYRIVASLISGIMAKESVVSSMELLFKNIGVENVLSISQAASFLVFSLLYTPCIAAINSIKNELGPGYAIFNALFQFAVAYLSAMVVFAVF